jgi:hypothetical protein
MVLRLWCRGPTTGERCFLERPSRHAESFPLFSDAFAQVFADRLTILLLDHRGAHPAQRLTIPATVRLVFFPPYGPALNPSARVWRDRNDDLAGPPCPNVEVQQASVGQLWRAYDAPR